MGHGTWPPLGFSAWSRIELGWTQPRMLNQSGTRTIKAGEVLKVGVPDTDEYFLLENRQKVGVDQGLPGSGLLIWHVMPGRLVQNDEGVFIGAWLDLIEASEKQDLESLPDADALSDNTDPFYLDNPAPNYTNRFDAVTSTGEDAGFYIDNISKSQDPMYFDIHFEVENRVFDTSAPQDDVIWKVPPLKNSSTR